MLEARAALRRIEPYRPPLAERDGLRLDFNENTVGCSPRVVARLRALDAAALARYPERGPVERAIAPIVGIAPEQLLLTNGVDEAIHLLCQTYLEPGDEALIAVPTFGMYRVYTAAAGARVVEVPAGERFSFPADALVERISTRTRLIAIANPNNPTGTTARRDDLLRIAGAAPRAAVLVDEAYFDFCGETVLDQVGRVANLFVARTFSKAYGLAGLRIGMLASDAAQMAMVRRAATPYNVNAVALACAEEALRDCEYVEAYVAEVRRSREALERGLRKSGIDCIPSAANFVLARIGAQHGAFVEHMRSRGILVRDRSADAGCAGWVRMTVGTEVQTAHALAAIAEWARALPRLEARA